MLIFRGVYFEVYIYTRHEQFSMSPQPGVFRPLSSLNQNPNGFLSPGSVVGSSVLWWYPDSTLWHWTHESMIRDSNESENCCDDFRKFPKKFPSCHCCCCPLLFLYFYFVSIVSFFLLCSFLLFVLFIAFVAHISLSVVVSQIFAKVVQPVKSK